MASGSLAALCASASRKVCGVGAAGSVGVTGSPMAPATCASTGLSMASASVTSFVNSVITLAPEKLVAASLTSSKLFLMSAISASRMASWNWPWNSAAILRALPIHWPTMRSTPGSSFGPMAISATTAMTTSSLHPMSNMKESAHAQAVQNLNSLAGFEGARGFSQPVVMAGSDRLAADVRERRRGRRRRIVVDRLDGLRGLFRGVFVFLHALLEGLDARGDVAHQIRNLAAPKQQQDHCDHDDPVPNAHRTHPATLQT